MNEFEELFKTFDTEGWLIFVRDATKYKEDLIKTAWEECQTEVGIAERRGFIRALEWVEHFQEMTKQTYQLKKEDESN